MRIPSLLVALVLASTGCGSPDGATAASPLPPSAGVAFSIEVARSAYSWEDLALSGAGLVATVRNVSQRDWFAKLGDGFNSSLDQSQLYIAAGTDASLEVREGDGTWTTLGAGTLVEGSRMIALRTGTQYSLRGYFSGSRRTGTMRIRLRYWPSLNTAGQVPLTEYSPTFSVR